MTTYRNANSALLNHLRTLTSKDCPVAESRNGNTTEIPMANFTVANPLDRYITLPGRKVALPAQIAETMWVLAGRNDLDFLSYYLPKAPNFSDDGKTWRAGYGPRLRSFGANRVDQLKQVVQRLTKDPDTRQAVISIFDGNADHVDSKDIPCNNWLHFIQREGVLNLHVATRSNDIMWGWSGINHFEWSVLLEVVAYLTEIPVGSVTYSVSSLHLYDHHRAKAERIVEENVSRHLVPQHDTLEDLVRELFNIPTPAGVCSRVDYLQDIHDLDAELSRWFQVEKEIRNNPWAEDMAETIAATLRVPLFRDFALCLWMWHRQDFSLAILQDAAMLEALKLSPAPRFFAHPSYAAKSAAPVGTFIQEVDQLHRDKNAAYGDSWSRRGEVLGIMANIARKVDRLGKTGGGDTALDTAIDLLVYLVKYRVYILANDEKSRQEHKETGVTTVAQFTETHWKVRWEPVPPLGMHMDVPADIQDPENVTLYLQALEGLPEIKMNWTELETKLVSLFSALEAVVVPSSTNAAHAYRKMELVDLMIYLAYTLALHRWENQQRWKARNATRRFNGYEEK